MDITELPKSIPPNAASLREYCNFDILIHSSLDDSICQKSKLIFYVEGQSLEEFEEDPKNHDQKEILPLFFSWRQLEMRSGKVDIVGCNISYVKSCEPIGDLDLKITTSKLTLMLTFLEGIDYRDVVLDLFDQCIEVLQVPTGAALYLSDDNQYNDIVYQLAVKSEYLIEFDHYLAEMNRRDALKALIQKKQERFLQLSFRRWTRFVYDVNLPRMKEDRSRWRLHAISNYDKDLQAWYHGLFYEEVYRLKGHFWYREAAFPTYRKRYDFISNGMTALEEKSLSHVLCSHETSYGDVAGQMFVAQHELSAAASPFGMSFPSPSLSLPLPPVLIPSSTSSSSLNSLSSSSSSSSSSIPASSSSTTSLSSNLTPSSNNPNSSNSLFVLFQKLATEGLLITKYPRSGMPGRKPFRLSFVEGHIYLTWQGKFGNQGVNLKEVSQVLTGVSSDLLKKSTLASRHAPLLSVICRGRSVDLSLESNEDRNRWKELLEFLVAKENGKLASVEEYYNLPGSISYETSGNTSRNTTSLSHDSASASHQEDNGHGHGDPGESSSRMISNPSGLHSSPYVINTDELWEWKCLATCLGGIVFRRCQPEVFQALLAEV